MRACRGCRRLISTGPRCPDCAREHDRARGTSTERGYGGEHRAERAGWVEAVGSGQVLCRRCSEAIGPDEPWDLGHSDDRSTTWPEHRRCNRATRSHVPVSTHTILAGRATPPDRNAARRTSRQVSGRVFSGWELD